MEPPQPTKLSAPSITIEATPLTREAFAPFGDVIENPRPDVRPSPIPPPSLPFNAVPANQGTALKYQHVSRPLNLYHLAPSGRPGLPVTNLFVCAARVPMPDLSPSSASSSPHTTTTTFPLAVLERHPYTTQTFLPLTAANATEKYYLVVVAPSLPPAPAPSAHHHQPPRLLPAQEATTTLPQEDGASPSPGPGYPRPLPGPGLPDLRGLRAFVATASQAVTYGAGTWHAPMAALGPRGTAVDFVVVQFANGVAAEDCQEVYLVPPAGSDAGGGVKLRLSGSRLSSIVGGREKLARL